MTNALPDPMELAAAAKGGIAEIRTYGISSDSFLYCRDLISTPSKGAMKVKRLLRPKAAVKHINITFKVEGSL